MPLIPGTKLGSYEVVSVIGAGGMANWATNSTHTLFVIIEAPLASRQTFRVILGK